MTQRVMWQPAFYFDDEPCAVHLPVQMDVGVLAVTKKGRIVQYAVDYVRFVDGSPWPNWADAIKVAEAAIDSDVSVTSTQPADVSAGPQPVA